MTLTVLCAAFALIWLALAPARADPALDALVAAYPDFLAGYDQEDLVWKDGSRMPLSDGRNDKTFDQLLDNPDIKDQFRFPYPLGSELKVPAVNEDPGRVRNEKFFVKMYGDCRKGEVAKRLEQVAWMPARRGGTLRRSRPATQGSWHLRERQSMSPKSDSASAARSGGRTARPI